MKTARRYARELAMQGIFQWQFNTELKAIDIESDLRKAKHFSQSDEKFFSSILKGVLTNADFLLAKLLPYCDCHQYELRPVEKAILLVSIYELLYYPQTPSAVILDEAVEITKTFGGTDGYKFVNGVLDKLASDIRFSANDKHE